MTMLGILSTGSIGVYEIYDVAGLVSRYESQTSTFFEPTGEVRQPSQTEQDFVQAPEITAYMQMMYNSSWLKAKVDAALTANLAWLNRPAAPTNAQVLNHVDRLTRQITGLLRYAFDRLDSSDGA